MLEQACGSVILNPETPLFADVIVPRHFAGPFTYLIPNELRPVLRVGHLVFVPFGRSFVQGAVISLARTGPSSVPLERLKAIRTLVNAGDAAAISSPLLELAKGVAESYVAPWGQCLRLVLPPKPAAVDRSRLLLTKEGQEALAGKDTVSPAMMQLLKWLKRRPLGVPLSRLSAVRDAGHLDLVRAILDRGWAHKASHRAVDTTSSAEPPPAVPALFLEGGVRSVPGSRPPTEVQDWQQPLLRMLEARKASRLMVQAPSVERLALLRSAVVRTVAKGCNVLVITGEAARAESLAAALNDPAWATAVFHSMMPDKRRAEIWHRISEKRVSVVVGTRAALFLPLHGIGLIWIDREEDAALKEPMEPRYHAREVAWMKAQHEQALLVLASAHLSLEASRTEASDHLVQAPQQADDWPQVEVVDLRAEDRRLLLSSRLCEAMRDAVGRQAGILLFLNRKSYAGALICRDCGQAPRCSRCAIAFAFSRQNQALSCHYCGAMQPTPELCAACGGPRLHPVGEGTERLEEEVRRRFPSARVLRVDGETLRKSKEAAGVWKRVSSRDWDVLVGTQVLLRNDIVPPVGLAGAVQADAGLSLPDFRAAERTFHLLHDAASLVEPMAAGGRLIIQSYLPSHHAIQAIVRHDHMVFESEELMHRTALGFPPALRVIVLHVSGVEESAVERASKEWAAGLSRAAKAALTSGELAILGPVRSPVARIRGRYRRQILLKCHPGFHAVEAIRSTVAELEAAYGRRRLKFDVDVDPIDMW
jgi:primosomal protein N' (replication factor Y) (superfamily II helicase)